MVCQVLFDCIYEVMKQFILMNILEELQLFEDWIDDDGFGNGFFKMKLMIWCEGYYVYFDWSGIDVQVFGLVNFYLNEGMFKMFIGVYLIMVFDLQVFFNDGFYLLLYVIILDGSLLYLCFLFVFGCCMYVLMCFFDVFGGVFVCKVFEFMMVVGYGMLFYMFYLGWDNKGEFYYVMEILYGGIFGWLIGDGMDGYFWWLFFENILIEYFELYYLFFIDGYIMIEDLGGVGYYCGGNGIEKCYVYFELGEVLIYDDCWFIYLWGIFGGELGWCLEKIFVCINGEQIILFLKCDEVVVELGDMLVYCIVGGGGWQDLFMCEIECVEVDVIKGFVFEKKV